MSLKNKKLTGINPLAYKGINPISTTNFGSYDRDPTSADNKNFNVGHVWLKRETSTTNANLWMLVRKLGVVSTWIQLPLSTNIATSYITDSGTATPAANIINFVGDGAILSTSCSGSTATVNLTNGSNGQVLIGGGAAPAWANITSTGGTIAITNGINSINLESTIAPYTPISLQGDAGAPSPAVGTTIAVAGGTNMATTADNVNTLYIAITDDVTLSGTLTNTAFGAGVVQSSSAGLLSSSTGTDGQVLIGGGTAPTWANITSTDGSIIVTNGANSIDLSDIAGGAANNYEFLAYNPSTYEIDIYRDAWHNLGEDTILTEIDDEGNNFYPGDGAGTMARFTAPISGLYFLSFSMAATVRVSSLNAIELRNYIMTSDREYRSKKFFSIPYTPLSNQPIELDFSILAHLDVNDIAYFRFIVEGSNVYDNEIIGTGSLELQTFVSGYLVKED